MAAAIVLFGGLLWLIPSWKVSRDGHHHHASVQLDAFEKAGVTELKEGQRGPGLRLRAFPDDRPTTLQEFHDKLVVLNFWATWCQPCTAEMPTLEALWQQYRARGLVVLAVSVDRGAPRNIIEPYLKHHRLTFPILLDPDMKTAGAWRVAGLPATFIIRPGGEVAGMATGAREWDSGDMKALIDTLLPPATR